MFNFIVTGMPINTPRGSLTMPHSRVFQHTLPELEERYSTNGVIDTAALMSLPTIITNESSSDPDFPVMARIGKITMIRLGSAEYQVEYEIDTDLPPIANAILESLAIPLQFVISKRFFDDFRTNHWAVKNADLFHILYKEGIGRTKPTIFKLPEELVNPKLVAVMMPFSTEFNIVHTALQSAAAAAGMLCLRADDIWDNDVIIQDVVKLIATARVVICDLSGKNANVFYEAGIAHTIGKDVILVVQHESDIPFDLRHIRYIKYLSNEQGLKDLVQNVSKRLENLLSKSPNNSTRA